MSDGISEAARGGEEETGRGEQTPQIKYGISIMEMDNDETVVHVTGEPDMGQLQRILAAALANLNADITARKVVQALTAEKAKPRIHRP